MTEQHPEQRLGKGMLTIGWLIALGLLTLYFTKWQTARENPNAMPAGTSANGVNELVLQENFMHHYVVNGHINGKEVTFLVDTGATDVAIPKHLARELKLKEGGFAYANTANGTVEVRTTTIESLRIGTISLRDVRANINPGMEGDAILLGMSALKNVEFTHRNGTLTLKQYH